MDLRPDEMKAVIARMKRAHGHLASVIRVHGGGGRLRVGAHPTRGVENYLTGGGNRAG